MFTYNIINTTELVSIEPAIIEEGVEISPEIEWKTLKIDVEYTFDNDVKKIITVTIFQPNGNDDIERSLNNRGITEEKKLIK
jgi:hypothetical protein